MRKKGYKEFAQKKFPSVSVNLKNSDALCLVAFALEKKENDFEWIIERVNKSVSKDFLGKKGKTLF